MRRENWGSQTEREHPVPCKTVGCNRPTFRNDRLCLGCAFRETFQLPPSATQDPNDA